MAEKLHCKGTILGVTFDCTVEPQIGDGKSGIDVKGHADDRPFELMLVVDEPNDRIFVTGTLLGKPISLDARARE